MDDIWIDILIFACIVYLIDNLLVFRFLKEIGYFPRVDDAVDGFQKGLVHYLVL